ncbi:MAG: hypothetical protein NTY53_22105 [Kiritimatiellaeota bacterium]|nr:hypothetical protein [Kiritimatiellota bacterium]
MSLLAKNKGNPMDPIPAGVHIATCYAVIDLGTHFNPKYNKEARKVLLQWELPECRAEFVRDNQKVKLPRAISKRYTLSLGEKANLRKDLESWRGRKFTAQELAGFDIAAIIGAPCQIQVVHEPGKDGRIYAAIAAIMALPKGLARPKQENPSLHFSFEDAGPKPVLPPGLPDWITEIIIQSKEWNRQPIATAVPAPTVTKPAPADAADDLPF